MKKILLYSTIYFAIYIILALAPNTNMGFSIDEVWGVIGYIILMYYLCSIIGELKNKVFWVLILLAVFFQFLGEVVLVNRELILNVHIADIIVESCYVLMPIFITAAIIYNIVKIKKVNGVLKKVVKSLPEIAYFLYMIYMIYFVVLNESNNKPSIFSWITRVYLSCDLFMLLIMIIFFIEDYSENMKTKVIILQSIGIFINVITDLIYLYTSIYNYYINETFINIYWLLGVWLIVFSGYYEINDSDREIDFDRVLINNNNKIKSGLGILSISGLILVATMKIENKDKVIKAILLLVCYIAISKIVSFIERNNLEKLNTDLSSKVEEINNLNKQLVSKNDELKSIAHLDFLTSLGNRRYIEFEINKYINLAKENVISTFAIVLIDLNRFKSINDWYGHDVGDELIIQVSKKLKKTLYKDVSVARQGGDEFILLIPNVYDDTCVKNIMEKVVLEFKKPIVISNNELIANLSIGIAMYPADGLDQRTLIKNADMAMYRSKEMGDNEIVFYHKDDESSTLRKFRIENLLKNINFQDEFSIYYQPQIEISHGEKLIGFEALIRWNSKELGFISPGEFIPIAEESGAIIDISKWVIRRAIKQTALWNRKYKTNIKIGINISPKYFSSTNFISELDSIIEANNIEANYVDLEITEEVSMKNQDSIQKIIHSLKEKKYQISIDDFGTGYSSFSYLSNLKFDTLKIAMPFIKGIHKKDQDFQLVKAIINMAKILGMKVIAEGLEEKAQLDKLRELGCHEVQGYYFSKPLPVDEAEEFIKASKKNNMLN